MQVVDLFDAIEVFFVFGLPIVLLFKWYFEYRRY